MEKSEPEKQDWAKKNIDARLKTPKERWQNARGNEKEESLMWFGYFEAFAQSLPQLQTKLPDVTFNASLQLKGSKRNLWLVKCRNGNTGSDAILILPKEGIVFMGDLLFNKRHPWLADGDPGSWKNRLEQIKKDTSFKIFVPGHGSVCGKEELQSMINYISDLQQMASEANREKEPTRFLSKDRCRRLIKISGTADFIQQTWSLFIQKQLNNFNGFFE